MLKIRYAETSGMSLGYSIERLIDEMFYDFSDSIFKERVKVKTFIASLPEDKDIFKGRFLVTMRLTPLSQFQDGYYGITIHDLTALGKNLPSVLACLHTTMYNGDDELPSEDDKVNLLLKSISTRILTLLR